MGIEFWNAAFERLGMGIVVKRHVGSWGYYMVSVQADGSEFLLNSAMSEAYVAESCASRFKYAYRTAFPEEVERMAVKRAANEAAARAALDAEWQKAREFQAAEAAYVHDYKVGDVLKGVWGYDQTNVDYFEVVAVVGKMLDIRPLQQAQKGDGYGGSSKCVPLPGSYQGEAVYRVRAQERGIESPVYGWLNREEPKIVGGVKVYEASYWSSDH